MKDYYVCTRSGCHFFLPFDTITNSLGWAPEDVYPWFKMLEDDKTKASFFEFTDSHNRTFDFFMRLVSSGLVLPFFGQDQNYPIVFFMLDDIQTSTARIHFVFSKRVFGKRALEIASSTMQWVLELQKNDGNPMFKALIGETSANNRLAWSFAKKVGFVPYGEIEDGFYNDETKQYANKLLSVLNLQTLVKR